MQQRGFIDSMYIWEYVVEPNFQAIQAKIKECEDEDQAYIKETFTELVPSIKRCGDEIVACDDFDILTESFQEIVTTRERTIFT